MNLNCPNCNNNLSKEDSMYVTESYTIWLWENNNKIQNSLIDRGEEKRYIKCSLCNKVLNNFIDEREIEVEIDDRFD